MFTAVATQCGSAAQQGVAFYARRPARPPVSRRRGGGRRGRAARPLVDSCPGPTLPAPLRPWAVEPSLTTRLMQQDIAYPHALFNACSCGAPIMQPPSIPVVPDAVLLYVGIGPDAYTLCFPHLWTGVVREYVYVDANCGSNNEPNYRGQSGAVMLQPLRFSVASSSGASCASAWRLSYRMNTRVS